MKHKFEESTWTDHTGILWVDRLCKYCGKDEFLTKDENEECALGVIFSDITQSK
jgi:hypothetical protein